MKLSQQQLQMKYIKNIIIWKLRYLGHGDGIQSHDGAEIHGLHILVISSQDLLDYNSVGLFRGVKWVPKCIQISVWAQV